MGVRVSSAQIRKVASGSAGGSAVGSSVGAAVGSAVGCIAQAAPSRHNIQTNILLPQAFFVNMRAYFKVARKSSMGRAGKVVILTLPRSVSSVETRTTERLSGASTILTIS